MIIVIKVGYDNCYDKVGYDNCYDKVCYDNCYDKVDWRLLWTLWSKCEFKFNFTAFDWSLLS